MPTTMNWTMQRSSDATYIPSLMTGLWCMLYWQRTGADSWGVGIYCKIVVQTIVTKMLDSALNIIKTFWRLEATQRQTESSLVADCGKYKRYSTTATTHPGGVIRIARITWSRIVNMVTLRQEAIYWRRIIPIVTTQPSVGVHVASQESTSSHWTVGLERALATTAGPDRQSPRRTTSITSATVQRCVSEHHPSHEGRGTPRRCGSGTVHHANAGWALVDRLLSHELTAWAAWCGGNSSTWWCWASCGVVS